MFFFCGGALSPVELAKIGQFAEKEYFGKPCGHHGSNEAVRWADVFLSTLKNPNEQAESFAPDFDTAE